ncbi:MAG: DUF4136 domain-containing protein [Sphingomonas sp.]|nr:DUF4136 domain-containing protein [Sphingomonas sp.]
MKKSLLLVASIIALSGCAESFNARVSRFQALPAPAGQTFVVQASDPRLQGGIEFGQYARIVASELVRQGYQPAADPARAELVVKLGYSVDRGRERVVSSPGFGYGGLGYGGFGYGGFYGRRSYIFGFNDPFLYGGYGGFGGFGGFNDVRSYTVFTSELDLQIERTDNGQRVFEGTARAQSNDDSLPRLVPNLIEAMFTGFPGNSGQTVNITIAPEKKKN